MLRRAAPLVVALLVGVVFARAHAGDPPPAPPVPVRVLEHDVSVRLLPASHKLIAEDRLLVESGGSGGTLDLVLDPALALRGPVTDATGGALLSDRKGDRITGIPVPAGRSTVVVRYEGVVFDAVEKAGDLTWVAGDGTRGLVSEKGVYLASSSRWIPTPVGGGLALHHVKAYVPEPFHVVTQGTVPTRTTVSVGSGGNEVEPKSSPGLIDSVLNTWNVLEARAVLPTDGLQLVAGPYETQSRTAHGVTFATWFYKSDAAEAGLWLDAMEAVVKRYAEILGPYPHPKFDIVENFFQTGWGMPSFTLLGDQVIQYVTAGAKRTGGKIPPGYLDHEYVHGWYGNGLFVDYAKGNWCEALTTYCSNYLGKELESVGEARAHRRGVLEKFSMRVKGAKDTPVRAFQEKTEDTDNDIGYGKGSLIFHTIRRQIGDEMFWTTLRDFTQKRVGTVVSWDDFFAAFDAASGISVSAHVKPYLDRRGLPAVSVAVDVDDAGAGIWNVTVRAEQKPRADGGPPFPLFLPVRIEGVPPDDQERELDLSSGKVMVGYPVTAKPRAVVIDPDYHALRQIEDPDLPPCLERTLAGGAGVVVLAGGGEKTFKPLAEHMAATKGFTVVGPEFDFVKHTGPVVVLSVAKPGESISIGGSTYDEPAIGVLKSTAEGGRLRTTFTALSEEAASRASRLPFYGWDPWVVFRSGRPIARDPRNQERPSTRIVLDDSRTPAALRIKADVEKLCSPEFDGRRPGTEGHDLATAWLGTRLMGWHAFRRAPGLSGGGFNIRRTQPFEIVVPRRTGPVRVLGSSGERLGGPWTDVRAFSFSGSGRLPLEGAEVVPWSEPSIARLHADAARRPHGAVYLLTPEAARAVAPWLDDAASLTPETEAELRAPGRDGKPRARPVLETWISGRRARDGAALPALRHPVLALAAAPQVPAIPLGAVADIPAEPVVEGTLLGSVPKGTFKQNEEHGWTRRRCVLLSAHYDSFGRQGEAVWVGADDNATGVACVLEVARTIDSETFEGTGPDALAVVVVLTDGEEWGLLGSRELVRSLLPDYDVRAVINVDSIGRAISKPTHILGLSKHPALARLVRNALETDGIVVGPDIDAYGYEHGSDHWPFHEAGIPAITLWASDYGVMNTADDTPEKVEPEGVAKIAAALARLLREDLDELTKVKAPAPPR